MVAKAPDVGRIGAGGDALCNLELPGNPVQTMNVRRRDQVNCYAIGVPNNIAYTYDKSMILKECYTYYYNTLKEVTIDCRLQVSCSTKSDITST